MDFSCPSLTLLIEFSLKYIFLDICIYSLQPSESNPLVSSMSQIQGHREVVWYNTGLSSQRHLLHHEFDFRINFCLLDIQKSFTLAKFSSTSTLSYEPPFGTWFKKLSSIWRRLNYERTWHNHGGCVVGFTVCTTPQINFHVSSGLW